MKAKLLVIVAIALLLFVISFSAYDEMRWAAKEDNPEPVRQLVGLPSIAVGNTNIAARNPGVEIWCTSFYDTPGGYCYYFTQGMPHSDLEWCKIYE